MNSVIGNIGGYVGLCLGYSILQLPDFVHKMLMKLKKWFLNVKQARSDTGSSTVSIVVIRETELDDPTEDAIENEAVTLLHVFKWTKRNINTTNENLQKLKTDLENTSKEVKSSLLEIKESISRIEYAINDSTESVREAHNSIRESL